MGHDRDNTESLGRQLTRRLGRSLSTLQDLADDHPLATELAAELTRGSPQAVEVLGQLQRLLSVVHIRQMSGLLQVESCSVAVVGPVNAGKSTLLNAFAGRDVAQVGATPGTTKRAESHSALGFEMVDTPGADEVAGDERRTAAMDEVEKAGVVIALFDASRGITSSDRQVFDLVVEILQRRAAKEESAEGALTPADLVERGRLVVVVNKSDMIPRDEREDVKKRAASDPGIPSTFVLPVSALKRRGLDRVAQRMVDASPGMVEALVEIMPSYAEEIAGQLVHRYSVAAATLALTPIPGPDVFPLTALQLAMVIRLSRIYGHRLTWKRSREMLPAVAAGFGWRELFRQIAKLVPVSGWAVSSGIAYAGTYATGRAAQHFLRTGSKPTPEQIEAWRREAREQR